MSRVNIVSCSGLWEGHWLLESIIGTTENKIITYKYLTILKVRSFNSVEVSREVQQTFVSVQGSDLKVSPGGVVWECS